MRWTNESREQTYNLERLEVSKSKLFTDQHNKYIEAEVVITCRGGHGFL